jgi:LuxR family maltose regulon positive regulatory protein
MAQNIFRLDGRTAFVSGARGHLGSAMALALAEPQGYVHLFVDEGKPMAELLAKVEEKKSTPRVSEYIIRLLSVIEERTALDANVRSSHLPKQAGSSQALIEPLSQRELEVLRLLRSDMSGPEIARELILSLATVRTHTQNIYAKLGVNHRRAAIRRAEELKLL